MELKNWLAPSAPYILPTGIRQKIYDEAWIKRHLSIELRDQDEALVIKSIPLPSLELQFKVSNQMPVELQVHACSVEIWLGKPVLQFTTPLAEYLRPHETRQSFRTYAFLNNFQAELLNPSKKDSLPPNVTINLTIHGRCVFGLVDKAVKITWKAPTILK